MFQLSGFVFFKEPMDEDQVMRTRVYASVDGDRVEWRPATQQEDAHYIGLKLALEADAVSSSSVAGLGTHSWCSGPEVIDLTDSPDLETEEVLDEVTLSGYDSSWDGTIEAPQPLRRWAACGDLREAMESDEDQTSSSGWFYEEPSL